MGIYITAKGVVRMRARKIQICLGISFFPVQISLQDTILVETVQDIQQVDEVGGCLIVRFVNV